MILNKSSVDRGLAHALLYKTEMIDLREEKGKRSGLEPEPHDARSRVSSRISDCLCGFHVDCRSYAWLGVLTRLLVVLC